MFDCPLWKAHGEGFVAGDPSTFNRVGVATANRPVTWSVTGADILSSTDTALVLEAFEGDHVVIKAKAKQFDSGWLVACDQVVPISDPEATPVITRTPAPPAPTPATPLPTPPISPP